jgi:predicted DNA-binding transcriptional regulator YafY
MTRTERLLTLLEVMRSHRRAISGQSLAERLNVSLRTVYRDIATLQLQGAHIEGSAGVGYILKVGFTLPPLMFTTEELEAIDLGLRWVIERSYIGLDVAASQSLAKLAAVLPADKQHHFDTSIHLLPPQNVAVGDTTLLRKLRQAIRHESILQIDYVDAKNASTARTIWPIVLAYFEQALVLVAWCETRHDFRHFRTDRIRSIHAQSATYPTHRSVLFKKWRTQLTTDKN